MLLENLTDLLQLLSELPSVAQVPGTAILSTAMRLVTSKHT